MTVSELMKELSRYEPDTEVVKYAVYEDMYDGFDYISFVDYDKQEGRVKLH